MMLLRGGDLFHPKQYLNPRMLVHNTRTHLNHPALGDANIWRSLASAAAGMPLNPPPPPPPAVGTEPRRLLRVDMAADEAGWSENGMAACAKVRTMFGCRKRWPREISSSASSRELQYKGFRVEGE